MDRWSGKNAVVTGASQGIGAAIAAELAGHGMTVFGIAVDAPPRNGFTATEKTKAGSIKSIKCDVTDSHAVAEIFRRIETEHGGTHVLVNNAGVIYGGCITDVGGSSALKEEQLLHTIDVNLKGVIRCSKHAIDSMKKNDFAGHIININSIAGHYTPSLPDMNVYGTSKHGVTAFTRALLSELQHHTSTIRITSISPGLVQTAMGQDAMKFKTLLPEDIADAVVYALSRPSHVNVSELTVEPVGEKRL